MLQQTLNNKVVTSICLHSPALKTILEITHDDSLLVPWPCLTRDSMAVAKTRLASIQVPSIQIKVACLALVTFLSNDIFFAFALSCRITIFAQTSLLGTFARPTIKIYIDIKTKNFIQSKLSIYLVLAATIET